jgi:hypothetical protein
MLTRPPVSAGAAGNFLSSINQLSVNAFKSVMDIDVLGSYNTLKATLPYVLESAAKHRVDPETCEPIPPLLILGSTPRYHPSLAFLEIYVGWYWDDQIKMGLRRCNRKHFLQLTSLQLQF